MCAFQKAAASLAWATVYLQGGVGPHCLSVKTASETGAAWTQATWQSSLPPVEINEEVPECPWWADPFRACAVRGMSELIPASSLIKRLFSGGTVKFAPMVWLTACYSL